MDRPDTGRNDLDDGAPRNPGETGHANGPLGEDDRWLRPVVENSSGIVNIVDSDGTLRHVGPAFGRILGYDPEEAVGTNVFDYVHPEDLPHPSKEIEKAASGEGVVVNTVEYRFRHKDGSWRWMEGASTCLPEDPAVRG